MRYLLLVSGEEELPADAAGGGAQLPALVRETGRLHFPPLQPLAGAGRPLVSAVYARLQQINALGNFVQHVAGCRCDWCDLYAVLDAALLPDVGDDLGHGGEGPRGRAEPGRGGGGEQVRGAAVLVVLAAQAQDRPPPATCTVSHAGTIFGLYFAAAVLPSRSMTMH